jgi:hypothetical protein
MSDIFLTCLTRGWEPLCNSCCNRESEQPTHAIDVDELITPEERKRFAFTLAKLHGVQHLHIASVPRGAVADLHQLHTDDCQVVYECAQYQPRA